MSRPRPCRGSLVVRASLLLAFALVAGPARAQGPVFAGGRVVVPTRAVGTAPTPMLGTFYPEQYVTIGGSGAVAGTGYSPLGNYGTGTLALYGPFSPFRATAAPVQTYVRGYDGRTRPVVATGFSYPFQPPLSPLVYPNRGVVRRGFAEQRTPPWWDTGFGWVDYN